MAASQPLPTATGSGGLGGFVQSLVAGGNAQGWQSYGQASRWNQFEAGQDIGLPAGTAVPGINGRVTAVTPMAGSAGDYAVTMQDVAGNVYRVLHIGSPSVAAGQEITSSTIIGKSGGLPSSVSSGPHIEFQVQPAGSTSTVDPLAWLQTQGIAPATTQTPGVALAQSMTAPNAPTNLDFSGSVGHIALQVGLFVLALSLIVTGIVVLLRKPIGKTIVVATKAAAKSGEAA